MNSSNSPPRDRFVLLWVALFFALAVFILWLLIGPQLWQELYMLMYWIAA